MTAKKKSNVSGTIKTGSIMICTRRYISPSACYQNIGKHLVVLQGHIEPRNYPTFEIQEAGSADST